MSWDTMLSDEFNKPYFISLKNKIQADKDSGKIVVPFPNDLIYRAFELTPLWAVKVVILGQDPYPNIKDAMGLAFSVRATREAPKSLKNIFKELKSDLGIDNKFNDLSSWAHQGVLLLNTVLTTIDGQIAAHRGYGWETFTDEVIKTICQNSRYVVYWLLGKEAQQKEQLIIDNSVNNYDIIKLPHPSPLSAHKGWFWSKPFSKTNELLEKNGSGKIDWRL